MMAKRTSTTVSPRQKVAACVLACVLLGAGVLALAGCAFTGSAGQDSQVGGAVGAEAQAQREACFANERNIDMASQTYYVENQAFAPDLQTLAQGGQLSSIPACPGGGTYTLNATNGEVTCSVHGRY